LQGSFRGIGSRFHLSLFEEVAPTLVMIGWALKLLEFLQGSFSIVLAADDFDNSRGPVGSDVVANDRVTTVGVGVCQGTSLFAKFCKSQQRRFHD
jgi:hypothetical protein